MHLPNHELLLPLRRSSEPQNSGRRQPATPCLRPVRHHPLSKPQGRCRRASGMGGQRSHVSQSNRATLRLLDSPGRLHGKQRDVWRCCAAGDLRGGRSSNRSRPDVFLCGPPPHQPDPHHLQSQTARFGFQTRRGVPGGEPDDGAGYSMVRNCIPLGGVHAEVFF